MTVWKKVSVDIVFIPESVKRYKYIVFGWNDLSEWVEGCTLKENMTWNIMKFLYEEVIYRYGYLGKIIINGKSENKGIAEVLLGSYRV